MIKCHDCNINEAKWVIVDMSDKDITISALTEYNYREGPCVCDDCKTARKIGKAFTEPFPDGTSRSTYLSYAILLLILVVLVARYLYYA